jgi:pimeloyl-ACP methyl ester carboxylesterase
LRLILSTQWQDAAVATFVLIHGAGDSGWYWHLVEAQLQARGHHTIAPDLPCDNDKASLDDYAAAVADAAAGRQPARLLVLVAGMIPAPGESPAQWWDNCGYRQPSRSRRSSMSARPVPTIRSSASTTECRVRWSSRRCAEAAEASHRWYGTPGGRCRRGRTLPTRFILCRDDHFFPAAFLRRLAQERLGIVPDEIPGCHCVALSHPGELAELLVSYLD